ncbi:MAG: hypothetical protein Q8Q26_17615 [Pseudorhodobacter sp.]|nr:hypothetical protein [Pseudorhodobacter sp.]
MQIIKWVMAAVVLSSLAGCLQNDAQRGVAGAIGGAVIADATGGSAVTGALIGGAAGVFCQDLNVPGCVNN